MSSSQQVVEAAVEALTNGDLSKVQFHPCLYVTNESTWEEYQWDRIEARWMANADNFTTSTKDLRDVLPPGRRSFYATYADGCCQKAVIKAAEKSHDPGGIEVFLGYGVMNLTDAFRDRYRSILEQPRGAGYWLWKPYVILKTLVDYMDWGDYLCWVSKKSPSEIEKEWIIGEIFI